MSSSTTGGRVGVGRREGEGEREGGRGREGGGRGGDIRVFVHPPHCKVYLHSMDNKVYIIIIIVCLTGALVRTH